MLDAIKIIISVLLIYIPILLFYFWLVDYIGYAFSSIILLTPWLTLGYIKRDNNVK